MRIVRVISTAHSLCRSHAFQHKFSSLSRRCMHSPENPWFRSNLLTDILSSCCDMTAEYTEEFRCLHSQKSREFRSRDRAVQLVGPRLLSTARRKSASGALWQCRGYDLVPQEAKIIRTVVGEEARVPKVLIFVLQKTMFRCSC
jgi:hypothetical protein